MIRLSHTTLQERCLYSLDHELGHGRELWNGKWIGTMNVIATQLHVTGTAQCTLNYLAYLE